MENNQDNDFSSTNSQIKIKEEIIESPIPNSDLQNKFSLEKKNQIYIKKEENENVYNDVNLQDIELNDNLINSSSTENFESTAIQILKDLKSLNQTLNSNQDLKYKVEFQNKSQNYPPGSNSDEIMISNDSDMEVDVKSSIPAQLKTENTLSTSEIKEESNSSESSDFSTSDFDSSDDENDSEEEELLNLKPSGKKTKKNINKKKNGLSNMDSDDDMDSLEIPKTKNEILEPEVPILDYNAIPNDSKLVNLGVVYSIVEKTVVVQGIQTESKSALDYGSAIVFDDFSVLGPVFDTFGPIKQPFYSILFKSTEEIDPNKIYVGRKVFYVEPASNFINTFNLLSIKGSDASNAYDEEISDAEIEFSDDEDEAKFNKWLKERKQALKGGNNNNRNNNSSARNNKKIRGNRQNKNSQSNPTRDHDSFPIPENSNPSLPFVKKELVSYDIPEYNPDIGF
ncbi:H/ACA ribonucleoprotein complex non-core subunit NAF1 [Smittium culicis]|uniref:H/ACA ribonucleoprotein complex non-core subunit NAF1 n=1 Tax=Smittium culicis TaxID=133412 RepID=A0A1R1XHP9_9FUNG|nr:H/ACA ribonucleoprotein complex non-core subunit NAF1 [Smittium culicis]OMJ17827.1 H/ACA ribonucleoprotein complex non-core subunit NAF1 [Smittium culicis]